VINLFGIFVSNFSQRMCLQPRSLQSLLLDLQLPLHNELEDDEAEAGAEGERGVEESLGSDK
jgi:hypothetical protein